MAPELNDPVLGRLVHNAQLNWYEGHVDWVDGPARLALSAETRADAESALGHARRLLDSRGSLHLRLSDTLVKDLLALKNGEWFDPEWDDAPYDRDSFFARVGLEGMTVYPDGGAEFFFEDGDLFFGHALLVALDAVDGTLEASLAG